MSALADIRKAINEADSDKTKITELNLQGIKIGTFSKEITKAL